MAIDAAIGIHQQFLAVLEDVGGLAEQCRGVVGLVGHVDDHRLVFDVVVDKAVDNGVVRAGHLAAIAPLFHLEIAGRGKGEAQRMADVALPGGLRRRGQRRQRSARQSRQGHQTHRSLP